MAPISFILLVARCSRLIGSTVCLLARLQEERYDQAFNIPETIQVSLCISVIFAANQLKDLQELGTSLISKPTELCKKGPYSLLLSMTYGSPTDMSYSMPHKVYHGKTGVIYNVTKSAVGVIIYKRVGNRYIEKRVNVRIEHVSLSRSREEFINRVKDNAAKKQKAKAEGVHMFLKRQPLGPREERTIDAKGGVETVVPIAYETTI